MEVSIANDPDLATEVITLLGKELKLARAKIKELQGQIEHGNGNSVMVVDDSRAPAGVYDERKADTENTALMEELQLRVKGEASKKESTPPIELRRDHAPNLNLENKIKELEEALEVYYKKYKNQKEGKTSLNLLVKELEGRVQELTQENEQLCQADTSKASQLIPTKQPALPGMNEFMAFMKQFPKCYSQPHHSLLHPVCYRDVDIAAYLASDANLAKFANKILYFPGRLLWCRSDSQHGLALGPQHIFDVRGGRWEMRSAFEHLYGKTFELFFLSKAHIFYRGQYACHNFRSWSPHGTPMPKDKSRVFPGMLVEATLKNSDWVGDSERKSLARSTEQLYIDQVLKVEIMGLQCCGFNTELYEALSQKFRDGPPAYRGFKREGAPLGSGPGGEKRIRSTMF